MSNNLNGFTDYVKDKIEYTLNIIPFGKLITTAKNNPEIFNASTDALKKSLGIVTGGSAQELQAVAIGSQEAVTKGIDNLKIAGICFAIGGVALLGLIGYNKLRELRIL